MTNDNVSYIIVRHTIDGHTTSLPMYMQRDEDEYVARLDPLLAYRFGSHEEATVVRDRLQKECGSNRHGALYYEVKEEDQIVAEPYRRRY